MMRSKHILSPYFRNTVRDASFDSQVKLSIMIINTRLTSTATVTRKTVVGTLLACFGCCIVNSSGATGYYTATSLGKIHDLAEVVRGAVGEVETSCTRRQTLNTNCY
jgi:hypothetical protein